MEKNLKLNKNIKAPLVTVYITNHNYGEYINKAIKSVFEQSLKNFELIIIDDGSKDKSKKIIDKHKDNKKITTIFQKNKGLIVSNNLALRLAKGKYILRLDADDWLDPHALEIMSSILEKNSKIGLVFPDYYIVNKNGEIIESVRRHNFKKVKLFDQPAHGACTMIRKDKLIDIGGYDEEFSCQDGYYLWLQFIKRYLVRNVNLPLFYYRQHKASLSKNTNKILSNRSKIIKKFINNSKKKYSSRSVLAIIPIRGLKIDPDSLVFEKIKKIPLIYYTINNLTKCADIKKIIITSPDKDILATLKKKYKSNKKLILMKRTKSFARINTEKIKTFKYVLKNKTIRKIKHDYILDMSINTPYLSQSNIETAINALQIFKADKVITVVQETHRYFKHDGAGLRSIIKNSNLKLERDAIFKQIIGFNLYKKNKFFINDKSLKISHIILSNKESLEVNTNEDIKILNNI